MALDTLARVLEIDCCWIQTINIRKQKKLVLTAERGFSPEMRQEIVAMDLSHSFSEQIIGMGHKIIIPDLSNDGLYGLPSFGMTGYKWLVAVPLMTYRAHGILGTASRNRKHLHKDTADLIMVIAGLIATSLSNAHLLRQLPVTDKPAKAPPPEANEGLETTEKKAVAPEKSVASENTSRPKNPRRPDGAFHSHARKMEIFRKSHS
jgi:transcriptional regulator with GAF, ATPase, and Fis domain